MNIRSAQKNDLTEVLRMNESALPHVSSVGLKEMEYFLKHADPFLVVEENGDLAGFMIVLQKGLDYASLNYQFFCNNYDDFDYVDRIVIAENYWGKGFGRKLYQQLINSSEKEWVTCEVNLKPPNPKSMEFHKALGFSQVAEQKTEGGKKSVAMLVKQL